jgi:hypothetical protein
MTHDHFKVHINSTHNGDHTSSLRQEFRRGEGNNRDLVHRPAVVKYCPLP